MITQLNRFYDKKRNITLDTDKNLITTWTVDTNLGCNYLSEPSFTDNLPDWQFLKAPITDYIEIIELEVSTCTKLCGGTYLTYIDRVASQSVLAPFRPTLVHQGDDTGVDSGEWNEKALIPMNIKGAKDLTLDFGFFLLDPFVTVGGIVWIDANKDGICQPSEVGIGDVTIVLTDAKGQPVTDVYGKPVPPVKTDANGKYVFEFLPVLTKDNPAYITLIDQLASAKPLSPYKPTIDYAGNDTSVDSATWKETTIYPTAGGMSNLTLDDGFITPADLTKPTVIVLTTEPYTSSQPRKAPNTGDIFGENDFIRNAVVVFSLSLILLMVIVALRKLKRKT